MADEENRRPPWTGLDEILPDRECDDGESLGDMIKGRLDEIGFTDETVRRLRDKSKRRSPPGDRSTKSLP